MSAVAAFDSPRTLIDDLLEEQQQLSAVERFARRYEEGTVHAHARYYQDLLPLTRPAQGEQYAFAVDLDACTGCKACVSACHSLNGLEEDEIWRNVGLLHGGATGLSYQQTVTTACHHCVEPACLLGCPVMAYEKDAETGIVRHLDDQCIGCQYCVLKCPYDVPKYSKSKGIVRKCDMCSSRLSVGEAPACVQACPTSAIRIEVISRAALAPRFQPGRKLLPGAFDSEYTRPTTRYHSRKPMPANARPADAEALRLEHAHWPLVVMLVLTQFSAGLLLALAVATVVLSRKFAGLEAVLALSAFGVLQAALGVSVLHLGRPLGAWRFFLGLRTSWMSREILAFSLFAASAGLSAAILAGTWLGDAFDWPMARALGVLAAPSAGLAALCGLAGVICSAMIYVDTRRHFWTARLTFPKFLGSTLLLGAAGAGAILAAFPLSPVAIPAPAGGMVAALTLALLLRVALAGWEVAGFLRAWRNPQDQNHRSMATIWILLRPLVLGWIALTVAAGLASLPAFFAPGLLAALSAAFALGLSLLAAVVERYLYFVAVVAPRMPGGVAL